MSLSFGSFGDIITTLQLVHKALQALSASRGSAREFQDLVVELRTFQRALDQLLFFWQTREKCGLLDTLRDILEPAVKDCQARIEDFLDVIVTKYGQSFSNPSGRRNWKVVGQMIQWHIFEKEKVEELRDTLCRKRAIIQLVQTQLQM